MNSLQEFVAHMKICRIPMIVIYNRPSDFPDHFVARLFDIDSPTTCFTIARTIEALYTKVPIRHMNRIPRHERDDLNIVETWV